MIEVDYLAEIILKRYSRLLRKAKYNLEDIFVAADVLYD